MPIDDDALRREARRRVEARNGFSWYLVVCLVLWTMFTVIWRINGGGYFWPVWPMLGMGIGLIFAGAAAFFPGAGRPGEDQIEREYRKLKGDDASA